MSDKKNDHIVKYHSKQSKVEDVPILPMRSLIIGPSASGKTYLLNDLITNIYKNCFERVYIFSQSIYLDRTYDPIKDSQKDIKDEDLYFETFNEAALQNIINNHSEIIATLKDEKSKEMFNICIVIDDFIDDKRISNNSKALNSLFIRGRHSFISTICLIQKYISVSPMIRLNVSALMIFKLKNMKDLNALLDETSALVNRKKLIEIYDKAIEQKYNFLYINLMADNINEMFFINFDKHFIIK
jgi:GTPase SAR1 family protein